MTTTLNKMLHHIDWFNDTLRIYHQNKTPDFSTRLENYTIAKKYIDNNYPFLDTRGVINKRTAIEKYLD